MIHPENSPEAGRQVNSLRSRQPATMRVVACAGSVVLLCAITSEFGALPGLLVGSVIVGLFGRDAYRRSQRTEAAFAAINAAVRNLDTREIDRALSPDLSDLIEKWNHIWPDRCAAISQTNAVAERVRDLPIRLAPTLNSIEEAKDNQEEAVEETASLAANMKQSMRTIGDRVEVLSQSSDSCASAALEMSSSIDEVASNTATLHEVVDASTSSVHEMGASIRQVAEAAENVQEMAEATASSMVQMDRSVQEVSTNAVEASALTEQAHAGATAGAEAVRATIKDIEMISSLTNDAKDRLGGLVSRISKIGSILSAIDEINDETKLLSLNAAIIAAQAGEQGKAFLVVANHVKTLSQRTAGSTHDIERLITDIEVESSGAVRAMEAGIEAVAGGVERSHDAGRALASIQESCRDASERVGEIARATSEQSRNSKDVAEATQSTSTQIQQITQAIGEQRRASESMLEGAERALETCRHVHRSTDEQRETSRHITGSISEIADMTRAIGEQTTVHTRASDSLGEAVLHLLDNAQQSASGLKPIRDWAIDVAQAADSALGLGLIAEYTVASDMADITTASPARCGNSSPSDAETIDKRSA